MTEIERPAPLAQYLDVAQEIEAPLADLKLRDHIDPFDGDKNGRVEIGEVADVFDGLQNRPDAKANRKLARTIVLGVAGRNAVQQVQDLVPVPKKVSNPLNFLGWAAGKTTRVALSAVWAPIALVNAGIRGAKINAIDHTGSRTHVGGVDLTTTDPSGTPGKKTSFHPERLVPHIEKYGIVVDGEVRLYESEMKRLVDDTVGASGANWLSKIVGRAAAMGELTGLPFDVTNNVDAERGGDRWITVSDFIGILDGSFWKKYERSDAAA